MAKITLNTVRSLVHYLEGLGLSRGDLLAQCDMSEEELVLSHDKENGVIDGITGATITIEGLTEMFTAEISTMIDVYEAGLLDTDNFELVEDKFTRDNQE